MSQPRLTVQALGTPALHHAAIVGTYYHAGSHIAGAGVIEDIRSDLPDDNGGAEFLQEPIIEYIYDTGFTTYRVGYASAMSYLFFVLVLAIPAVLFVVLNC